MFQAFCKIAFIAMGFEDHEHGPAQISLWPNNRTVKITCLPFYMSSFQIQSKPSFELFGGATRP